MCLPASISIFNSSIVYKTSHEQIKRSTIPFLDREILIRSSKWLCIILIQTAFNNESPPLNLLITIFNINSLRICKPRWSRVSHRAELHPYKLNWTAHGPNPIWLGRSTSLTQSYCAGLGEARLWISVVLPLVIDRVWHLVADSS